MPGMEQLPASAARPRGQRLRAAAVAMAFAAICVVASPGTTFAWAVTSFSTADEQLLFTLTNQDRASANLPALTNDTFLHKEAEWRAQDMGDNNYFSHNIPPDNKMVFAYMSAAGYCYKVAGENIGLSTYGDGEATAHLEIAFMGSPSHRANILGTWARMGIGAYKAADGRKLYTVLFSIPCGVVAPTPIPVATPTPTQAPTLAPGETPTPTPYHTPAPTIRATPRPTSGTAKTAAPVGTAGATPTSGASASPSSSASPSPTAAPTVTPTPTPVASPSPSASPSQTTLRPDAPSLRVRPEPVTPGPLQSFFDWLFGGLVHW